MELNSKAKHMKWQCPRCGAWHRRQPTFDEQRYKAEVVVEHLVRAGNISPSERNIVLEYPNRRELAKV